MTQQSILINADATRVWAVISDLDAMSTLLPRNASIRALTDRTDVLGARWLTTTKAGDRYFDVLTEIIEMDPGRTQTVRSQNPSCTGIRRTTLVPSGSGTLLTVEGTEYWEPGLGNLLSRLLSSLSSPVVTRR